jgi:DNA-binding transcriptional MocR family regulator
MIPAGTGPRYLAIADAIAEAIRGGALTAGMRLPTHRDLAEALGVTVGTVTRGYAEAARRGLLRGETGRGTFVGGESPQILLCHNEDDDPGVVDLSMTLPLESLSPSLADALRAIAAAPDAQRLLEYYPSRGRLADRQAGAQWLRGYGVDVPAEVVAVTVGGQNALAVVLSAMFRPGDAVAVEGITYPLIKTLARRFHLRLVPVEQDQGGMLPEALDEACRLQPVRGVYVMPGCQNPTTARMPDHRRHELADVARRRDLVILEDDAYAMVAGPGPAPLAALAPERTFFIASMSKGVAGGLRVAYLAAPPDHVRAVERAISDMVWMTPPLMAEIARRWIDDGTAERTLAVKRLEAARRSDLTRAMLSGLDICLQKTGYFAWLRLPEPWTSGDFARVAAQSGVLVTPDEAFVVGRRSLPHAVRLSISGPADMEGLRRGLGVIKEILHEKRSWM